MNIKIGNGDLVEDMITGFKGIIICDSVWLNGCRRVTIQPRAKRNGKPIESETFDDNQVRLIKKNAFAEVRKNTGGPQPEPKNYPDPKI